MNTLDKRLGVNVGNLIGHSAVRYYVMGDECQGRAATPDEIEAMRGIVRGGMTAGALGLSVSKNRGHYDPQGVHIPAFWAEESEIFALADVLSEMGVGTIQSGGGRDAGLDNRLMTRLAEACGRQVVYNNLGQSVRQPDAWKQHMALIEDTRQSGHSRQSAVHAQQQYGPLYHAQPPSVPGYPHLASDFAGLRCGETARLQRSRGAPAIAP